MKRFIRLDMEGHWKGNEHCSTFAMDPEYWGEETDWENGISCYALTKDPAGALENLRYYWEHIAQMRGNYTEPTTMLVTVFEGDLLETNGSDFEEMATCEKTISQFLAQEFMNEIIGAYNRYEYGDDENDAHEDEKVYTQELMEIVKKYKIME